MEKLCPACKMPFDWPGVDVERQEYCCAECSAGFPCSCPQHDHRSESSDARAGLETAPIA